MSDKIDPMDFTDDIDELCGDMDSLMDMSDLDDLPTAIIVTNVANSVFNEAQAQATFEKLFLDLDGEATFAYLKNFKRVRVQFSSADTAGIARIKNDGVHVCDQPIRCYFFQLRTMSTDSQHLQLPKPTKMFLISPPASPPVGWESVQESEPVVNYDLLHAIANLNPGETHELHPPTVDAPSIVVHLCEDPVGFGADIGSKQKIIQTRRPGPSTTSPTSDKTVCSIPVPAGKEVEGAMGYEPEGTSNKILENNVSDTQESEKNYEEKETDKEDIHKADPVVKHSKHSVQKKKEKGKHKEKESHH